jgi:hypothetical protein
VLDEDGDEIPHAPGIQGTVLLLDDILDDAGGYFRKFLREPVNYAGERPHLFAYSHRLSVSHQVIEVKS